MNRLTNFLRNNPKLLSTYVRVATTVVDKTLAPLNLLMRHVLVVQGLDPNSRPGDKLIKLANQAMEQVQDPDEYDEDYDFSWVERQWKKTAQKLNTLNLTKERYRELTNLERLEKEEPHEVQVVASPAPLFDVQGNLNPDRLHRALDVLKKYAEDMELEEKPVKKARKTTVSKPRQPVSVGRAKTTKKGTRVDKKFKGVFRRVED